MELTILSTAFRLVLAHSSLLPTVASYPVGRPPFMVAFPLIPILVYTLIVSAFSYVSVRIFKRFKLSYDLFGFLRRKGRFSPFGISPLEHELLPTSTPSRLSNAAIGVYAESSNVSILRSSSVNILPGSPPSLISLASSPPPNTPFRRAVNRSLASFPLLDPAYAKPRRSRSLSDLISPPHGRPSRSSPSPPPWEEILDDNAISRDWIPLAPLTRNVASGPGIWSSGDTLIPAPVLNVSISAPTTPRRNSDRPGPLIEMSPSSSSSSDLHKSSLAIMSSSSSELPPPSYSSSSKSDSDKSSGFVMSPSQSSDVGAQCIGGAIGFAYDWGFETKSRTIPNPSEKQDVVGPPDVLPIFSGSHDASHIHRHEVHQLESQNSGGVEQEKDQQVEMVLIELQKGHIAEPILANDDSLSQMKDLADTKITLEEIIDLPIVERDSVNEIVVWDFNTENALTKASQDTWSSVKESNSLLQPLTDEVIIGERPSVSIDTTQTSEVYKEGVLLSTKKSFCPSPLQTPTPPESPPLMPMTIARSTSFGLIKPPVPTESETVTSVEKGRVDGEGVTQENGDAMNFPNNQEAGLNVTMAHEKEDVDVEQMEDTPIAPASSETSSPDSVRPAWSARAIDAPPLGLSVVRAATVEEEVAWPRIPKKKVAAREYKSEEGTREVFPAAQQGNTAIEDLSTKPVQGVRDIVQAPVLKSTLSLPGSFPEEPKSTQKVMETVSVTSMTVGRSVVGTRTGRRQQNITREFPIDVALAMQLRPGFGVGADPAWMVRFLMSVFGWFAIMIAGRGGDVDVYAL